ncbi:hypothetical protein [uncultured Limnobacter sp.]|uniref:hypothetical protein n=1 Tax=uncultured Limnobacter sp. TaxID=199681 RepID=UPI0030F7AD6F
MNQIEQVTTWIDAAQQKPSVRNVANYLAYTMSELGECLHAVDDIAFGMLANRLESFSESLRNGTYNDEIALANRTELLDGAIDTAWCAIGLAHMLGDAQGAFAEVAASNHSKFENGVCELDATGKVVKGPSYFKPDLAKFLRPA